MSHIIMRRIAIDAGHRIMTHGSKCRHLHGHRYTIEASCRGIGDTLHQDGEQTDMVLDFGFLDEEMKRAIDAPCDHGFISSSDDTEVLELFVPAGIPFEEWLADIRSQVESNGYAATEQTRLQSKLYVIKAQPTAECLAEHWFSRLKEPVHNRSDGLAALHKVRVWETPNCWAEYEE